MRQEPDPGEDFLDALAGRLTGMPGRPVAVDLSAEDAWELVTRLDSALDADGVQTRMVLGAACPTTTEAIAQFVTAMQLPYRASRSWEDFLGELGERPVSQRQCLVVTDACALLRHESFDRWRELVGGVCGGPYCMGGGWTTLVLADREPAWREWVFRSAADTARRSGWELPVLRGSAGASGFP